MGRVRHDLAGVGHRLHGDREYTMKVHVQADGMCWRTFPTDNPKLGTTIEMTEEEYAAWQAASDEIEKWELIIYRRDRDAKQTQAPARSSAPLPAPPLHSPDTA